MLPDAVHRQARPGIHCGAAELPTQDTRTATALTRGTPDIPHPRVRMALYNQGQLTDGPFRLNQYPRSRAALHKALSHRRFAL